MTRNDLILIAGLTALGVVIGMVVRWRLAALAYRRDEESTQPPPGTRWWVPLAVAAAS